MCSINRFGLIWFVIVLCQFFVPAILNQNHNHEKEHVKSSHHDLKKSRHHFGHLPLLKHHHHAQNRNANNSSEFQLFWNADVVGEINLQSNASGVLDIRNKINVVASSSKAFAIDLSSKIGYKLDKVPNADELKNPSELLNAVKNKQGFNVTENEEFSVELNVILKSMILNYVQPKEVVKAHLEFLDKVILENNNGSVKGLFSGSGSVKTATHDYIFLAQIQSALSVLLENYTGGLESLTKQGVQFNLTEIVIQPSGTDAVLVILKQIGEKVDLTKVLGSGWDLVVKILKAIQEFKATEGIDGLLNIVAHLIDTIHGNGSIDLFIETILTIARNRRPIVFKQEEIKSIIDNLLNLVSIQNRLFKNAQAFEVLLKVLRDLNDNNLILENINLTAVLNIFASGDVSNGIQLVIQIFTRLGSLPQNGPKIFASLLRLSQVDLQLIIQAGIHLPLDLQQNLGNISNIRDLLTNLHLPGNLSFPGVLDHLPVIGDIAKAFNGSLDINGLFNSSLIQDQLKNITANIPGPFGQIFNSFFNQTSGIGQQISAGISGALGGIFNGSENIISNIENGFQGIVGGISGGNNSTTPPPPTENRQKNAHRSKHFRNHHEKEQRSH